MNLRIAVIVPMMLVLSVAAMAPAHEPVPGPNFQGCKLLNFGSVPYAPLPRFNIMVYGGPVLSWPVGDYDFCAYLDTVYCSLPVVERRLQDPRVTEFSDLIMCLYCDINGPLVYPDPEGEEDEDFFAVPVTPNGIPDGKFELGILAGLLNDTSHPFHAEATAVYQNNFMLIKDTLILEFSDYEGRDVRAQMRAYATHLCAAMAATYAAYLTMGDDLTNLAIEEMYVLFDWIISEPLNWAGIQTFPDSGPHGDANNNGFTNREAYHWYVDVHGYDSEAYVSAALDMNKTLEILTVEGATAYDAGDTVHLEAQLAASEAVGPFKWYRNGSELPGETGAVLIDTATEANAVVRYDVSVMASLSFVPNDDASRLLEASKTIIVGTPDVHEGEPEGEGESGVEGEWEGEPGTEGEEEGEGEGEGEDGDDDTLCGGCDCNRNKALGNWLSEWLLLGLAALVLTAFHKKKQ